MLPASWSPPAALPTVTARTLRVMQVVLSLVPGGTQRLVVEIVRYLRGNAIDSSLSPPWITRVPGPRKSGTWEFRSSPCSESRVSSHHLDNRLRGSRGNIR